MTQQAGSVDNNNNAENDGGLGAVLRVSAVRWTLLTTSLFSLGAMSMAVALGIHVYDVTNSKRDLGLVGLAEFLPTALLVLVSGGVADRFDRKRISVAMMFGELVAALSLIPITRSHPSSAAPFLVAVAFFGTCRAFSGPAMRSLVPAAAPAAMLPRVVALSSISWQTAKIGGPIIGAWTYRRSPETAYAVSAAIMASALICAVLIPRQIGRAHLSAGPQERPTLRDAFQGLRVVRNSPILFGAISLDLFAVLFGGAVALLPSVSKDLLNGGASEVGLMNFAGGVSASLVTVLLAARPLRRKLGKWLFGVVALFGLSTIVLGYSRSLWLSIAMIFVLSAADSVSVFIRSTLVPLVTPAAERGRVLAVEAVFIGASNELGAFESGEVAHHFGTVASIVSGGMLTLAVAVIWWFWFKPLRDVDRFADVTPS